MAFLANWVTFIVPRIAVTFMIITIIMSILTRITSITFGCLVFAFFAIQKISIKNLFYQVESHAAHSSLLSSS